MTIPRLERADLRVMDAYPGEHYPVEVEVETGSQRQLRCGCSDALEVGWPHA